LPVAPVLPGWTGTAVRVIVGGVELTRDGARFAIKQWAPFDRI
jgi:hypothetical protein